MNYIVLIFLSIYSADLVAQHSPKGRIDILNEQQRQEEESTKDLIFKTNKPLKAVVAGGGYIAGDEVCEVEIATSYFQSGDKVEVEAQIENYQCGASNGKYTVRVKTQDEAGETYSEKHDEVWSRNDNEPVLARHVYALGKGSELLSARVRMPSKDYCTCLPADAAVKVE